MLQLLTEGKESYVALDPVVDPDLCCCSYLALQSWLGLLSKRRPGHDPIDPGRSNATGLYPHIVPFNTACVSLSISRVILCARLARAQVGVAKDYSASESPAAFPGTHLVLSGYCLSRIQHR